MGKGETIMVFVEVGRSGDIAPGAMKAVVAEGRQVLVVNVDNSYYAIARKCPHLGGDLSKGVLEGKVVTCPRHGSRFDVTTGAAVRGPKIGPLRLNVKDVTTYAVRVEGDSIQVSV